MTQRLVSEELLRNMADALKFFASEMTVGQRYTDHGQTALDAPGEIHKLLEQPSSGADWWRLKLPGGRHTDDFESARVGDYNRGWNDYRKAAKAALSAPEQPAVEPACWEWRWFDANPNTVTFGQWSEWKRVEPRNALCTVEDSLNEFRTYIANGQRYELRPLFTTPQAQPAAEPVSHQYQDRDGKWYNFMNEKHHENTKADGRWPIRALYVAPQAQPRKAVKLTPEEMKAAVEHAWGSARIDAAIEMYGHEYRAIEQAVLKKNGVTE